MNGIFSRLSKCCSLQSIHFIQPVEPDLVSQLSKLNLNENENPNTHTFFDSVMKCLPKIESLRQRSFAGGFINDDRVNSFLACLNKKKYR